jgi:hypothetical protein
MHVHFALCLILAAIDWNFVLHNGPARLVALAVTIAPLMQLLKRFIPSLGGWKAVALNVVISTAGVIAVTPPDKLLEPSTLASIFTVALAAAGIHGTSKLVGGSDEDPADVPQQQNPLAKPTLLLLILGASVALLGVTGCSDFERQTYKELAASQAVVNQAQDDYESRLIPRTPAAYAAINKAKAAQTLAVQSMATYEKIKEAKGAQTALDAQQQIVAAALQALPDLIAAVRATYTAPTAPMAPRSPAKPIGRPVSAWLNPHRIAA